MKLLLNKIIAFNFTKFTKKIIKQNDNMQFHSFTDYSEFYQTLVCFMVFLLDHFIG